MVLDAEISGSVFQQLDVSGLYPVSTNPPSGEYLSTIPNVTVSLDGATTTTSSTGTYTFMNVVPDVRHTVSVQLPAGYDGFSAESLSCSLVLASDQKYSNLNFALTPRNQAVVQNMYELVLSRPADVNGFNTQVGILNNGGSVGRVLNDVYTSNEFKVESQPIASMLEAFFPGTLDLGAFRNSVQLQNLSVAQDATVLQILYSQQFVAKYGDLSKLSDARYVRFMYQKLLNRAPNKQELQTWVNMLKGKGRTRPPPTAVMYPSAS